MAAIRPDTSDYSWNAGFGAAASPAARQVATLDPGANARAASPAGGGVNYGSIQNADLGQATTYSSGNPVWDVVEMSNFLARQQQLTLWITLTTERASESGQKVQLSSRQITYVRRPDRLAVEITSDEARTRIIYDGTAATVIDATRNLYGTIPVQGPLESVLDTLAREYGMAVPADDLLYKGAYDRIAGKIKAAQDLGRETLDGRSCRHVAFTGENVDFQMWVESREQPVPRKVVVIYKNLPGRPRCKLDIDRVETGPIADSVFKVEVPAGAQQIRIVPRTAR
jgi:hypothetical protein